MNKAATHRYDADLCFGKISAPRLYRFASIPDILPWNLSESSELKGEYWKAHEINTLFSKQIQIATPVRYFNDMFELSPIFAAEKFELWKRRIKDHNFPLGTQKSLIDGFFSEEAFKSMQEVKAKIVDATQVICFSSEYSSPTLWGHYAKGGKGLCIEIIPENCKPIIRDSTNIVVNLEFLRGIFAKVKYSSKRPKIDLADYLPIGNFHLRWEYISAQFLTKHIDWKFEKEFRVIFHEQNASLKVDISRVLLGPLFDPKIENDLRQQFPNIKFCNTRLSTKSYQVEVVDSTTSDQK